MSRRSIARLVTLALSLLVMSQMAIAAGSDAYNWWIIGADGSAPRQITRFTDPSHGAFWSLSPDGALIAVSSSEGMSVVDLSGQLIREFSTGAYEPAHYIRWDSDDVIVFMQGFKSDEKWFTVCWPDGSIRPLVSGLPGPLYLSSDRRAGVVIASTTGLGEAFIINLVTGARNKLPFEKCTDASWCPTGDRVIVECETGLAVVDRQGGIVGNLPFKLATVRDWSADGESVLLGLYRDSLIIADVSSGRIVRQLHLPNYIRDAVISPDSSRVAFIQDDGSSAYDSSGSLWVTNWADQPEKIASNSKGVMALPAWTRDGKSIVFAFWPREASAQIRFPKAPTASVAPMPSTSSPNAPDFRNARWGMTVAEAKASDPDVYLDTLPGYPDTLPGLVRIAGHNAFLYYKFVNGRLATGAYALRTTHTNDNLYIDDFNNLKSLLTSKYGTPDFDEPVWKNSLYRDDPDEWGFAVLLGHLKLYAAWETPRTSIMLMLSGDNYKADQFIMYKSKVTPTAAPDLRGL